MCGTGWLNKEAEYYRAKTSDNASDISMKRRYVEILGSMQYKLWARASAYDWMIADSQKRIEQIRSAHKSADGKTVTWRPSPSSSGPLESSGDTLKLLRSSTQISQQRKALFEALRTSVAVDFADPDLGEKLPPGPVESAMTGEKVDARQSVLDLMRRVEIEDENAAIDLASFREVLRDAEERGRNA